MVQVFAHDPASTLRLQMAIGHCTLSLWRIACEIVINLEVEKAFKKLPLRPWLWMTFFFGVA